MSSAEERRSTLVHNLLIVLVLAVMCGGTAAVVATTTSSNGAQTLLAQVDVQQAEVAPGVLVALAPRGDDLVDTVTLDLCAGSYPSETLRTARRKVVAINFSRTRKLTTEAVLYASAAGSAEAFSELRRAADHCPSTFVPTGPFDALRLEWRIGPRPDRSWPRVRGIQRLAFDVTLTTPGGQSTTSDAVYLRRGRYLLAISFEPGLQLEVDGRVTAEDVTEVLAHQLASVPLP